MKRSLRSWLWRVPLDQEVDDEIAFHVEMRTRELIERGVDPKEARAIVLARLGDVRRLTRTCVDLGRKRDREMAVTQWLGELRDDVKFAVRQLKANPGFTMVAVLTLALGIGANGAIFALVDATLLRPLPLREPDRLVVAWEQSEQQPHGNVSPLNMLDWNDRSQAFEKFAGFSPSVGGMVMAGADGAAETVPRQWVTTGVFDVLGVTPVAGRTFLPEDEKLKAGAVVLSEAFWRSRFNSDRSVIGREVRLDGDPFTIVGVVPQSAQLIGATSMWAMRPLPRVPAARAARFLRVIGRMKQGVTFDAARADMARVGDGLAREFPEMNKGRGVLIEPMQSALVGSELRVTSLFFLGVVGFVLLICCANVANLLLARATVRSRELAIRSALGAGRRRIVRQLLTESLVLAVLGGALGLGVGVLILAVAPSVIPQGLLPGAVVLTFDARVVSFCAATALLIGVLFGLAPVWHARESFSASVIATDTRTTTGRGGAVRSLLVVGEIATAVLLLFGAGLLLRTLLAVDHVDRGYRAESVLTVLVDPLGSRYPTPASLLQFFDAVAQEVKAVPGVRTVAWASTLPMGTSQFGDATFEIVGDPPVDERQRPSADYQIVSPSYFDALDLPIRRGPCLQRSRYTAKRSGVHRERRLRPRASARSIGDRRAHRVPSVRRAAGASRDRRRRPSDQG
jgi:putative ABC transport system permease protein